MIINNYIYFNRNGGLKRFNVDSLIQGSVNVERLFLFADFDLEIATEYRATISFQRVDGFTTSEIELTRESEKVENPYTKEQMPAFSIMLGANSELSVAGSLGIVARYYSTILIDEIEEEQIKATAIVNAFVYESIPTDTAQSQVISNINRKVNIINTNLIDFKEEIKGKYGVSLQVDNQDVVLLNEDDEELSRTTIPTVIQVKPLGVGDLLFSGNDYFLIENNKKYLIIPLGNPEMFLHILMREESAQTSEVIYTPVVGGDLLTIESENVLEISSFIYTLTDVPTGYTYELGYKLDGVDKTVVLEDLESGYFSQYRYPVLAIISTGYYQVYSMD